MTATTTVQAAVQTTAAYVPAQRWTVDALVALFELPFNDLLFRAQEVHRQNHDANAVQRSTLLSIKTGGCSEDCGYCSQSAHHGEVEKEALLETEAVVAAAQAAKDKGATRFCMGAAWRGPKDKDLDRVTDMIGWACSRTARPNA
jgi:biotin synthase